MPYRHSLDIPERVWEKKAGIVLAKGLPEGIMSLCRDIRERMSELTCHADVPEVSIVVPALNEADASGGYYILTCLDAISELETSTIGNGKVQVIVVNNNSTDQTGYLAELCGAQVVFEPEQRIQAARQKGIREAKAPIIFQTDADTIVSTKWIDSLYPYFSDPNVAGLCGEGVFYGVEPSTYAYKSLTGLGRRILVPEELSVAVGFNMAYRKDAGLKTIDTSPKVGRWEDILMVERLKESGAVLSCRVRGAEAHASPRRIHRETFRKRLVSFSHTAARTLYHFLGIPTGLVNPGDVALEKTPWLNKDRS